MGIIGKIFKKIGLGIFYGIGYIVFAGICVQAVITVLGFVLLPVIIFIFFGIPLIIVILHLFPALNNWIENLLEFLKHIINF